MSYFSLLASFLLLLPMQRSHAIGERIQALRAEASRGAAFKAKVLCSAIFVGKRNARSAYQDLAGYDPNLSRIEASVNYSRGCVTTSIMPIHKIYRTACYQPRVGCRLVDLSKLQNVPATAWEALPEPSTGEDLFSRKAPPSERMDRAVASLFQQRQLGTRALVVLHKDRLVAEHYAPGFTAETRQQGWSMSKSVTATLLGIRAKQAPDRISLDKGNFFQGWAKDARSGIQLSALLHMSSGLKFYERYDDTFSDAVTLLYGAPDMATFALSKAFLYKPETRWSYSSGTTAILQRILRNSFDNAEDYWRFPYQELFYKIGAASPVIEMDAGGTFIGAAGVYATPRDFARLGSLYLHRGKIGGEQLVDESWLNFLLTPAPAAPHGKYGGQVWLNRGDDGKGRNKPWPGLPEDAYAFVGHRGQNTLVIPSLELVVVRMAHAWRDVEERSLNELVGIVNAAKTL